LEVFMSIKIEMLILAALVLVTLGTAWALESGTLAPLAQIALGGR
jgi:hypothetical protein